MVKANAYGHGLVAVAKALRDADGLAVARLDEAVQLRAAGVTQRVLLLGTLLDAAELAWCSDWHVDVCAHSPEVVASIVAAAEVHPLRVWLELDSGMNRMGLDPEGFVEADRQLSAQPRLLELVHMTHFSSAEEALPATLDPQLEVFKACHGHHSGVAASLANSAALLLRPDTHADWVRPGLMLYGINPLGRTDVPLQAAMRLSARVIAVRNVRHGEAVGYNRQWVASRDSRVATVGIGYGDGYPRHAPSGTPVWINGCGAALAGKVSMDSIGVDVTDCERVDVGDEAVLWGPELSAALIAERAGTISYALFAGVTGRVLREYGCT